MARPGCERGGGCQTGTSCYYWGEKVRGVVSEGGRVGADQRLGGIRNSKVVKKREEENLSTLTKGKPH